MSTRFKYPQGDTHFEQHGEWYKYQVKNKKALRNYLDETKAFLDLGAHCGTWTLWFAPLVPHVYSYEPVHYGVLEQNLVEYNIQNVSVRPRALSNSTGTRTIWVRTDNSGDTGFLGKGTVNRTPIDVHTTRLDLETFDHPIGTIKMDLQGHELEALQGAEQIIRTHTPTLCVEFDTGNPMGERLLKEWGYTLARRSGKDWIFILDK